MNSELCLVTQITISILSALQQVSTVLETAKEVSDHQHSRDSSCSLFHPPVADKLAYFFIMGALTNVNLVIPLTFEIEKATQRPVLSHIWNDYLQTL